MVRRGEGREDSLQTSSRQVFARLQNESLFWIYRKIIAKTVEFRGPHPSYRCSRIFPGCLVCTRLGADWSAGSSAGARFGRVRKLPGWQWVQTRHLKQLIWKGLLDVTSL